MQPLVDPGLLAIIEAIRTSSDEALYLIDDLCNAIRGRKIMLKYTSDTTSKCIFLTRSTLWKLRSFFLNKSRSTFDDDTTAEYLNDVFVDISCVLELYTVV